MDSNDELELFFKKAKRTVELGLRSKMAIVARLERDIDSYNTMGYTQAKLLTELIRAGMADTTIGTFQTILARIRRARK